MKGKSFLNKKNLVIGLISCILIGASATGVTIFLKDNGEAAAAGQQEPIQNLPVTGNDVDENNQEEQNTDAPAENSETPSNVDGEETSTDGTGEESSTDGTEDEEGTSTIPSDPITTTPGGTPSEEEIIAGITETTIEQERKVYEDLKLSWTTIAIPAITTNMGIYKPELQIEKTAVEIIRAKTDIDLEIDNETDSEIDENEEQIENEIIEVDPENKPRVRPGDTIIFKIEVSNVGNYKATNVVITDSLDVIFEDKKIEAGNPLAVIETLDYGKKATLRVAYEVTEDDVNATEIIDDVEVEKNIYNVAYATDGRTTIEDDDDMPVNPELEVSGTKTWDDADNQDGKRPESITVRLWGSHQNEEIANQTIIPDENGDWTYAFVNLPKYDEENNVITYTTTEDEVAEYETEMDGYDIVNTHIPETTTITGSKTWEDSEDQDGKRPESITIRLIANGEEVKTATVTAEDEWKWTFAELPVYKAGTKITYTITEDEVAEYETKINVYDVTNSYEPETTTISGSKTWDDANDQDGKRPESITIRLLANGEEVKTATVTAKNDWKWSLVELPVYEAGTKITYTITEDTVAEYETKINGYNVTNSYTPKTTSISGKKTWNDNNNKYGNRPESITINLLANEKWVAGKNVTMDEDWDWEFDELPVYESGNLIDYKITEDPVLGYTTTVNEYDVTNTTTVIKVSGTKTWDHKGNKDVPSSITINLLADGTEIEQKTITANNNWKYEFTNLPKYKNSKEVNYTVTEDPITDYTPKYTSTKSNNGDITVNIKNTWGQDITGEIITLKQVPVPLDVVFVLDISSSMLEKDGDKVTRVQDMVEATNEAIKDLMANPNNRVSVVLFNSDVYQLTDTDAIKHYSANNNGDYITYNTVNETYVGGRITFVNGKTVDVSTSAYREGSLKCGTYTQGGIKTATNIFSKAGDSTGTRKPVMILLTDGDPTHYDTKTSYNQYGTKYPTVGEGIAKLRYITAEYYAYTMKTMQNCKSKITGFYGEKNCEVYTVGINMQGSMAKALLQPSTANKNALKDTTNISTEIHNHGDNGEKTGYSVIDSDGKWRKDAEYYKNQSNRLKSLLESDSLKVSSNYANKAYTESTSSDISENFDDIVNTIIEKVTTTITADHYGEDRRIKLEGFKPNNTFSLKITQNGKTIVDTSDITKVGNYIKQDTNDGHYYLTLTTLPGKANIALTYYK